PACFVFKAEDGIRDCNVTGVQTCALPIYIVSRWHDSLTQTTYLVPDEAVSSIQKHLTTRLIEYLNAHEERQSGRSPHRTGLTARSEERRVGKESRSSSLVYYSNDTRPSIN